MKSDVGLLADIGNIVYSPNLFTLIEPVCVCVCGCVGGGGLNGHT